MSAIIVFIQFLYPYRFFKRLQVNKKAPLGELFYFKTIFEGVTVLSDK